MKTIRERFTRENLKKMAELLFFPITILFYEIIVALHAFGNIGSWNFLYITLFSLSAGFLFYGICILIPKKARFIVMLIITALIAVLFGTQAVYYTVFKTFTTVSSALRAGDVLTDFGKQALQGIWQTAFPIIFILLPFVLLAVFGRKFLSEKCARVKMSVVGFGLFAVLYAATILGIYFNTTGIMPYRYVYFESFSQTLTVPRFGVLTTLRLDIQDILFEDAGPEEKQEDTEMPDEPELPEEQEKDEAEEPSVPAGPSDAGEDTETDTPPEDIPEPVVYEPRVLEIDFEALIANETNDTIKDMHEYFSNVEPTMENEYTGMFAGKNLIWIVAEAFHSAALDEMHTPTLYKMAREGFVFNNFYNPIWGVSTSDGEYTTLTGLIPKSGVWSFSKSSANFMPFGFGTLFSDLGYAAKAYHNHTYTYYDRDSSHPNMGYDYKGRGNGLDVKKVWPGSDVEMMEKSVSEYVNEEQFHVYYLTVSGHLEYNFMGNTQSYDHKAEVQDMLDAGDSEGAAAYIACQMEFDQSMEYLVNTLSEAGVLEDTVIVISGDHYPYGLEEAQIEELLGYEVDSQFELYRSTLMIWNSEMEPEEVNKYCSSLDVMPTLANLFDLPVDSRLVMGRDILSDSPGLVIFDNRSFITDLGRYNSRKDQFIPNEGAEIPEGYALSVLEEVNDKFEYSKKILEKDYYAKVFAE